MYCESATVASRVKVGIAHAFDGTETGCPRIVNLLLCWTGISAVADLRCIEFLASADFTRKQLYSTSRLKDCCKTGLPTYHGAIESDAGCPRLATDNFS